MKFHSPTEVPIHIALTSGHTCVIGTQPVEVEKRFHRLAVAEGAIPEGMTAAQMDPDAPPDATKPGLIQAAIRKMVTAADAKFFNSDGRPDVRHLSALAGFHVSGAERDDAWQAVNDE